MKVHSFYVKDAEKHGVEKAVILYNLRFWLEKNKANNSNLHDGHYWTFNSAKAFTVLFPYYTVSKIERLLRQMEKDGLILSGVYNKKGYDRTKWYSMPEFKAETLDDTQSSNLKHGSCKSEDCQSSNLKHGSCKSEDCQSSNLKHGSCKSEAPIPDINPDSKPYTNTDIDEPINKDIGVKKEKVKSVSKKEGVFKPVKPEQVSDQTWNDLLALRKKKRAVESQTAWTRINNSIERAQQATGHTLENIFSYWVMRAWAGFDEKWYINAQPKPQQSNYQGNTNERHQSANHSNQPKQSSADIYAAKLAEQRRQRDEAANAAATGCDRANIYDMEETF